MTNSSSIHQSQLAALILRISLGVILLAHSAYLKVVVFTMAGTSGYFESLGLPGFTAYLVVITEIVTGIALILGVQTRWASLAVIPVLIGATWAHSANGWLFNSPNGGWEFPAFLVITAIVQSLLGDGAYALKLPSSKNSSKVAA